MFCLLVSFLFSRARASHEKQIKERKEKKNNNENERTRRVKIKRQKHLTFEEMIVPHNDVSRETQKKKSQVAGPQFPVSAALSLPSSLFSLSLFQMRV